jgi:hypothetical protein
MKENASPFLHFRLFVLFVIVNIPIRTHNFQPAQPGYQPSMPLSMQIKPFASSKERKHKRSHQISYQELSGRCSPPLSRSFVPDADLSFSLSFSEPFFRKPVKKLLLGFPLRLAPRLGGLAWLVSSGS